MNSRSNSPPKQGASKSYSGKSALAKMSKTSDIINSDGVECNSYDLPVTDGAFKTHNATPDEIQREVVTDRGTKSYFKTSVRITTCLHGYLAYDEEEWDDENPGYATLVVFEYRLHALKPGHVFSFIRTTFKFQNAVSTDEGDPSSPSVIAWAPFHHPQRNQESTASVENKWTLGAKVGAPAIAPVDASANAKFSTKESHLQQYFQKGAAGRHFNDKTRLNDSVWLTLEQNQSQNLGVEQVFKVAVLIGRKSSADFVGKFKIELQGSFCYALEELSGKAERFFRRVSLDDPINFSPMKKPQQGKVDGLEAGSLGLWVTDEGGLTLPPSYHLDPFLPL